MVLSVWNMGPWEWIIVAFLFILVFGAKRLPEMGKSLGTGLREFKKSLSSINEEEEEHQKIDQSKEKEV